MKVYSYQEMLKFKEKCYRGNLIEFGEFSKYGCSIPIYYAERKYNLCLVSNYTNIFTKGIYKDLSIFKKIFKKDNNYFRKFLLEN